MSDDYLAVHLEGGPLSGWHITEAADGGFQFNREHSYTFAIEMQVSAAVVGRALHLSQWMLYDYENYTARFREVTWVPPPDSVVVQEISGV